MTDALRLDDLPNDILILIFDYCHAFDLVRLSEVCIRFNDLICSDTLWIRKSKLPLVTNQTSTKFRERCHLVLCLRKKWQISQNWQNGKYVKRAVMHHYKKVLPWIQLSGNILWWCGGNKICGFYRTERFDPHNIYWIDYAKSDICKFIVQDHSIISGHRDGSIQIRSTEGGHNIRSIEDAHSSAVHAVERVNRILIGGSASGILKVWGEIINVPCVTIDLHDRIWSIAGNHTMNKFAVGCTGWHQAFAPLRLFDLETCEELYLLKHTYRRGAGILDMVWDNPYTLLTCGYDTCIRKWDTRIGKCVAEWADPTDATTYCLSTDYQYTMVTGTQFNCKAVLWDQRQTNFIQLYFMNLQRLSSPVYSISFDNCHLYGATDELLVELNFSGRCNKSTNYRNLLNYDWNQEQQNNFLKSVRSHVKN